MKQSIVTFLMHLQSKQLSPPHMEKQKEKFNQIFSLASGITKEKNDMAKLTFKL